MKFRSRAEVVVAGKALKRRAVVVALPLGHRRLCHRVAGSLSCENNVTANLYTLHDQVQNVLRLFHTVGK